VLHERRERAPRRVRRRRAPPRARTPLALVLACEFSVE